MSASSDNVIRGISHLLAALFNNRRPLKRQWKQ